MRRNIGTFMWLVAGLALALPVGAHADGTGGTWVEVTGEAAIVAGNKEAAKAKAKDQALRQAVAQVAGTIVSGITQTKQFMTVRDEITSQGAGFVERYQQEKTVCDKETCKVTIKALVAKGKLRNKLDKLGLLIQQHRYPRVILLISERFGDDGPVSAWWGGGGGTGRSQIVENTLIQYLNKVPAKTATGPCKEAGNTHLSKDPTWAKDTSCWKDLPPAGRFRFVDYTSILTNPVVREAAGASLTDSKAVSIARLTDAEVALVGSAVVRKVVQFANPFGAARLSLRALDVTSGKVLGSATVTASGFGSDAYDSETKALVAAARLAVPKIQKAIADTWQNQTYGSRWVEVRVAGIKSYTELIRFQGMLKSGVTGVQSVQQRRMNGSTATLEVQCTSSAQTLATELSSRPLGKFSVNVTRVEPGIVGLTLSE